MSVEQYGAGLLAEVQEESLDELLRDVSFCLDPQPKGALGLKWLDELLELFRYHQQPVPTQHSVWPGNDGGSQDDDDEHESPAKASTSATRPRPAVIEVSSSQSAAGKTSFLYLVTAFTLLPSICGGKASAAVWIDSDGRFSITHLFQIMRQLIPKADTSESSDSIVCTALNNLYVLSATSSTQLLANLQALPASLLTIPSSLALSLLVLDSATAFTAQDRFDADIARLEAGPDFISRPQTPARTMQIISALRDIQKIFDCTIMFSTNTPPQAPSGPTALRPPPSATTHRHSTNPNAPQPPPTNPQGPLIPIVSPFSAFALLHLRIFRIPITQFAPGASLTETLQDREKRQTAVQAGRFSVGVDWSRSDRWPPGVREAVDKLAGRGRAEVRITGEGVDLL